MSEKKTVFIVDQKQDTREYIEMVLEKYGFETQVLFTWDDPKKLKEKVIKTRPQIIIMRIIDNEEIEFYNYLKSSRVLGETKVIFTTLHDMVLQGTSFPIPDLIRKTKIPTLQMPFYPEQLIEFIEEMLEPKKKRA